MRARLLIEGRRACFRRAEFRDDLVSYDMMPPVVAKMIVNAVLPLPRGRWKVRSISILNPINADWEESVSGDRGARVRSLRDVAYVVEAAKPPDGQGGSVASAAAAQVPPLCLSRPTFLGLREFTAAVSLLDPSDSVSSQSFDRDLGWLPFDDPQPPATRGSFCRAVIRQGMLDLSALQSGDLAR